MSVTDGNEKEGTVMKNVCRNLMNKKSVLALAMSAAILTCGCGNSKSDSMASVAPAGNSAAGMEMYDSTTIMDYAEAAPMEEAVTNEEVSGAGWGDGGENIQSSVVSTNRKLIRTVDMSVETKKYDELMGKVESTVLQMGGYIQNMDSSNGSIYSYNSGTRWANMTIRIPKDRVNEFLTFVEGETNVVRRSENVEDVTLNYTDLESRKKALKIEYDRLLALLEKAEYLEDIITLEDRLSNVRYEMERIESSLRGYDDKIDFGTVNINISEVEELTPVVEETLSERMRRGFEDTVDTIVEDAQDLAVVIVVNSPYLAIIFIVFVIYVLVLIVLVKVILAIIKRKKKKAANRKE